MSRHHPKNTTLTEFAAGTLDEGRSLVVAAHLTMCGACREFVAAMEEAGGQMLDAIEPVAMREGAVALAMTRLGLERPRAPVARRKASPLAAVWQPEKNELLGYDLGPWRWVSPGLHYRAVNMPSGHETRVFMLKARPGLKIPQHKHTGTELTCVLSGAFIHEGGRYAAGDCDDADQNVDHSPVIDEGEECVCLVAMQGQIKMTGFFGRMIQPFVRI
jgi:putative transcriptional regulator